MNLHRADKADWEKLTPDNWNGWQRLAARTGGIATPANLISLAGACLVFYGLYLLTKDQLSAGVICILTGRLADILDGAVADYTKTKSPRGEAFDATIDKVIIFSTLLVLLQHDLVPLFAGLSILFISVYVSLLSIAASFYKRELHPSAAGKLSTAFGWIALALYILEAEAQSSSLQWAAGTCLLLFLLGSLIACTEYTKQVYRAKT